MRKTKSDISLAIKTGHFNLLRTPYAFTEHGILMLSSFLNSERALKVNIEFMRALVKLRQMLASNADLSCRLDELESKYDRQFKVVFDAIQKIDVTASSRSQRDRLPFAISQEVAPQTCRRLRLREIDSIGAGTGRGLVGPASRRFRLNKTSRVVNLLPTVVISCKIALVHG